MSWLFTVSKGLRLLRVFLLGFFLLGAEIKPGELILQEAAAYRAEGRRLQEKGQLKEAAGAYRKAIEANPRYADVYNDLGIVLESLGELEDAEAAYRAALRVNPGLQAAHSNLALLYERRGRLKEAAEHWTTRVKGGPAKDPWVVMARAKLLEHNFPVPDHPKEVDEKPVKAKVSPLKPAKPPVPAEPVVKKQVGEEKPRPQVAKVQPEFLREQAEAARQRQEALRRQAEIARQAARRQAETARKQTEAARRQLEAAKEAAREMEFSRKRQAAALKVSKAPTPAVGVPTEPKPVAPKEARDIAEELVKERTRLRREAVRELIQRGVAAIRQGQYEQAITHFRQTLALDPANPDAKEGLRRAEAALKKSAK